MPRPMKPGSYCLSTSCTAVYVCIVMMSFTWLYVLLFIQESAPAITQPANASQHGVSCHSHSHGAAAAADAGNGSTSLHSRGGSKPMAGSSRDGSQAFEHELAAPGHAHASCVGWQQQEKEEEEQEEEEGAMIRPLLQLEADPIPHVVPHAHEVLLPPSMQHKRHGHGHSHAHTSHHQHSHKGAAETAPLLSHEHAPCGEESGADGHHHGSSERRGRGSEAGCSDSSDGSQASKRSSMLVGWRIIKNSPWYCKIAAIWVIVAMTNEGAQVRVRVRVFCLACSTGVSPCGAHSCVHAPEHGHGSCVVLEPSHL
jgi:hypothetical protein